MGQIQVCTLASFPRLLLSSLPSSFSTLSKGLGKETARCALPEKAAERKRHPSLNQIWIRMGKGCTSSSNHPQAPIKKISLGISIERGPCNDEAEKLAAELVKFEEVDLTEWHQLSLDRATLQKPNILALLGPLISASTRGNSKLKKLSLSQFDEEEHSGVRLQAKARFEVVNVKSEVKLSENDYEELRQILIKRLCEEGL